MPQWLTVLAWAYLSLCFACALWLVLDVAVHPQHMPIMNVVWPVNALYWGPVGVWAYRRYGRPSTRQAVEAAEEAGQEKPGPKKSFRAITAEAVTHCGAGCTLGDIIAEWMIFGLALDFFGRWQHHALFTSYVLDFIWAYALGIVFQYFTIAPMRGLGVGKGIVAAIKADTLSLTAFEIGLFGWMALPPLVFFGHPLDQASPVYWFMMQIGMIVGFFTAYPVNGWLLEKGLKEKM